MRSLIAPFLAALVAATSPVTAGDDGVGLRAGIMPEGHLTAETAEASVLLFKPSPTSMLTFSTAAAVEPGGWLDRNDAGATAFTARLRAGYQATPSLTPFVEAAAVHRAPTGDGVGSAASTSFAWRAGVAFDHAVSGEVALGYAEALPGDASGSFGALTVDGSLAWAPTPLTMVTLTGTTSFAPPTNPVLSPGSVVYDGSFDLAYAWNNDVDVAGVAGVRQERHRGTDLVETRYRAGFNATWKVNQFHQVTAGYVHEWRDAADPAQAGQSDAMRVEFRMAR